MFNNIKTCFSEVEAKKILGKKDNAINYLNLLPNVDIDLSNLKKLPTNDIWKMVVETWNYEISKNTIRKIFRSSTKYRAGKESTVAIDVLLNEWKKLNLGEIKWPCSQGDFDIFVQRINSQTISRSEKDNEVKLAAIKYRRLKE